MTVNATAIWRVRPSGSNTNGGGYDPGISGASTDYSQQNSAQATGTTGTSTASTTFTDAGGAFTSAMIGNALWLASATGTPTVGAYFITAVGSATSVTLDRASGTYTAAHYAVGGGWADPVTNTDTSGNFGSNAATWLVPGNIVYVLGSGTPNPSSYTYDYTVTNYFTPAAGNATAGDISFKNDPATPGYLAPPNTTGGMPVLKVSIGLLSFGKGYNTFSGLWFVAAGATFPLDGVICTQIGFVLPSMIFGCVYDQFNNDTGLSGGTSTNNSAANNIIGCEVFSSTAPSAGSSYAVGRMLTGNVIGATSLEVFGCNFHDTTGGGIDIYGLASIKNSIIAKCQGNGATVEVSAGVVGWAAVENCTIDGNTGNGISLAAQADALYCRVWNNIISNNTGAGKFGLTVGAGTAAANSRLTTFIDYNVYYNNTSNYNAINAGPHDTALGTNPYVGQATENYTLA